MADRAGVSQTRIVSAEGFTFGVHERGTGPPVLLLHGLLTDSRVWSPLVRELERDHTLVAVDAPGHGGSPPKTTEFTLEDEVQALGRLVRRMFAGHRPVWIGHSMGGMKAMRAALRFPEIVGGLVLVSTQPYPEPEHTARPFEAMVETVKTDGMSADLAEVVAKLNFHRRFLATPPARSWIAHFQTLTGERIEQPCHAVYRRRDLSGRLRTLAVPALVVHGADDVPIRVRVARRYVRLLPQARLVELPETGHTPPCERPEELAHLVREFLDSQAAGLAQQSTQWIEKEEAPWR